MMQCPVCRGNVAERVTKLDKYDKYDCAHCGLGVFTPLAYSSTRFDSLPLTKTRLKERIKMLYYGDLYAYEWIILKKIKELVPRGGYIWDVGCGEGHFMLVLKAEGYHVYGIDPSSKRVDAAKASGLKVHLGTIYDAPKQWPRPSAIVMLEVLEHLPFPVEILKDIRERYPEAHIFISVPDCRTRAFLGELDGPPGHLLQFNYRSLSTLALKAGYKKFQIKQEPFQIQYLTGSGLGLILSQNGRNRGMMKIINKLKPYYYWWRHRKAKRADIMDRSMVLICEGEADVDKNRETQLG